MMTGIFPNLKLASVRPDLKQSTLDSDVLKNFRPVSNLSYLSKIVEKVIHIQLDEYAVTNKLFSQFQSGYRKLHSCETAITKIHNDILMMIDKKQNVVLLLLDLSAAFDTVNHELLLKKLKYDYGISGNALNLLKSYLTNRKFQVVVGNGAS